MAADKATEESLRKVTHYVKRKTSLRGRINRVARYHHRYARWPHYYGKGYGSTWYRRLYFRTMYWLAHITYIDSSHLTADEKILVGLILWELHHGPMQATHKAHSAWVT